MQESNFKDFFKLAFGLDCEKMKPDAPIFVGEEKVYVKSYNHKKKTNEDRLVQFAVRKKDDYIYKVFVGEQTIEVTRDHRFYVHYESLSNPIYIFVKDMETILKNEDLFLLNINGTFDKVEKISKNDFKEIILDIQVQGNENYFSNNYLSHNSLYGNPEVTSGGNALKFYASQRIDVRKAKGKSLDDDGNISNTEMNITVVKNKLAPPFRKAKLMNVFNVGIDNAFDILNVSVDLGFVKKSGSWFSYGDTRLGQGVDAVCVLLRDNPDLLQELETQIRTHYGI
jgi:hypothetical protein